MNKSQLKARTTRFFNHIKNMDTTPTYEKQLKKKKSSDYYDARKRID